MSDGLRNGTYQKNGEEFSYELHLERKTGGLDGYLPKHACTDEFRDGETHEYYWCPRCGTGVHEWMNCIECGWYDEDAWEKAVERYENGRECVDDPEQTTLLTDGGIGTSNTDTSQTEVR